MADIDQNRRAMLTAKYGIDRPPMNPALNTTVQAVLDAEQIVDRQSWGRRIAAWVDPAHSPKMYEIVSQAHRDLRAGMAAGQIEYDDHADDGYPYNPDDPADACVLIHFVGSNEVKVWQATAAWAGGARRALPHRSATAVRAGLRLLQQRRLPNQHRR